MLNKQVNNLMLKKFINSVESLDLDKLNQAKQQIKYHDGLIVYAGDRFNEIMIGSFEGACKELGLNVWSMVNTEEYFYSLYDECCYAYIEEMIGVKKKRSEYVKQN